jgi:hypothetical protein
MKMLHMLLAMLAGYAQRNFALWAYGTAGFIGIGKESSWGTAVAVTDYLEALNESLVTNYDRFIFKNMIGSTAEPDDHVGIMRVEGEIVVPAYPTILGHLLKGAFNNTSLTTVLSGFLYRTEFVTPNGDFSTDCPMNPYTLEVHRDVTSSFQFSGANVNMLRLDYRPNQEVRLTAGFIAKQAALIAKTTPTFVTSPAKPFAFDTASLTLDGTGTARIEALTIDIVNNLEGIAALNATNKIAKIRRTDFQMINISGTVDVADVSEWLDFINQTERRLMVTTTKANSFQFSIDIPRMVYTAFPVQVGGRERLVAQFTGKGFYHSGSGNAFKALLTTTKSNF